MRPIHSKIWLYSELVLLMIGLPMALYLVIPPKFILPVIWLAALYCHLVYRMVSDVPTHVWWGRAAVTWRNLRPILLRFGMNALLLTLVTWWFVPQDLFGFVRERPKFWALIMVLYPIISAIPQEIIFRSFFFTRYARLFPTKWAVILGSGVTFGLAHLVFHNWVAPGLCVIGGVMFAQTYYKHRSLLLVAIEHGLYGDFLFTVGLGRYFYHGSIALAQTIGQ